MRAKEAGEAENGSPVWADGWMAVSSPTRTVSKGELAGPVSGSLPSVPSGWLSQRSLLALKPCIMRLPPGFLPPPSTSLFPGHLQMQASTGLEIFNFALLYVLFLLNRLVSTGKTKLLTSQAKSLRHAICNLLESSLEAGVGPSLTWVVGRGRAQRRQLVQQQSRCEAGQKERHRAEKH